MPQKAKPAARASIVNDLALRADLPTVAEELGIYVTGRGSSTPKALCPFHEDKKPSLVFYRDHPENKINQAARQIFAIWNDTKTERLTQLVFCDLSTPKQSPGQFSAYDELRRKLLAKGIPAEEIAFIQDYDTDSAKALLFKRIRSGQVRVTLGSTQKMGTGTNVQERLIALHHLDAPWRPADIEQREGRILRQGNKNPEVKIFRYVTEGSFDAYMWGVLETKAKFIGQVMTNESHVRKIEDLDAPALTYAEVKAIASGNPLVIEKAQVDAEVMRLTRLRSQHEEATYITRHSIRTAQADLPRIAQKIANLELDLAMRQSTKGDAFSINIGGQVYVNREVAGEALNKLANTHHFDSKVVNVGTFAGFPLELRPSHSRGVVIRGRNEYVANLSDSNLGTISSLESTVRNLDSTFAGFRQALKDTEKKIHDLEPHAHKTFEHEDKLVQLVTRQQEIIKALDLSNNQASIAIESDAVDVPIEGTEVGIGKRISSGQRP